MVQVSLNLGRELMQLRKFLKLSQLEFGMSLNTTQSTISKYENGKLLLPFQVVISAKQELDDYSLYLRAVAILKDYLQENNLLDELTKKKLA